VDPNWSRWIFASISDAFNTVAGSASIPFYVEGADKDDDASLLEYFEFRINGPDAKELSKDFWCLTVEVNIFCAAKRMKDNFHRIHTLVGLAQSMFTNAIQCYKYGTSPGDDSTGFLCMQLDTKNKEDVVVSHFGQLDPNLLEMRATVDGFYEGYLDASQ
jgi:hypothetical protein